MIDRLEKEIDILDRHLQVLEMVTENEPIGIVKMADETGYRHHKIRYSLRVLEEENLIEPTSHGATTTDQTSGFVDEIDQNLETVSEKLDRMKLENIVETPR
jgi:predicted transcriptional regulator